MGELRLRWLIVAGCAAAAFAATVIMAWDESVPRWELDLFEWINGWPSRLSGPSWPLMQLGMVVTTFVVGLVFYAWRRQLRPALLIAATGFGVWLVAKVVKEVVGRPRPGGLLTDVVYHLDGGPSGLGFVSGHAAVAFTLAVLLIPFVRRRWAALFLVLALLASTLRVYVGAHLPLDSIGGAAFGVMIGSLVNAVMVGRLPPPTPVAPPEHV